MSSGPAVGQWTRNPKPFQWRSKLDQPIRSIGSSGRVVRVAEAARPRGRPYDFAVIAPLQGKSSLERTKPRTPNRQGYSAARETQKQVHARGEGEAEPATQGGPREKKPGSQAQ